MPWRIGKCGDNVRYDERAQGSRSKRLGNQDPVLKERRELKIETRKVIAEKNEREVQRIKEMCGVKSYGKCAALVYGKLACAGRFQLVSTSDVIKHKT